MEGGDGGWAAVIMVIVVLVTGSVVAWVGGSVWWRGSNDDLERGGSRWLELVREVFDKYMVDVHCGGLVENMAQGDYWIMRGL